MNNVIILSQSTTNERYSKIIEAGLHTWVSTSKYPVIYYSGGETFFRKSNLLTVPVNDGDNVFIGETRFDYRAEKFISALEYCFNTMEFDFIYRTTCTSYINTSTLEEYIQSCRKFKVFDGALNMDRFGRKFVGTYNCLLSKDIIEQILKNKEKYLSIQEPEDLALGILLYDKLKYINDSDYPVNNKELRYCIFEEEYKKEMVCYKLNSEKYQTMYKIFFEQNRQN